MNIIYQAFDGIHRCGLMNTMPQVEDMPRPPPGFIQDLIMTVVEARDKLAIEEAVDNVVNLPAMGYGPYTFDVTYSQLLPLITAAYNATVKQLADHPPRPYSSTNISTGQPVMDTLARSIIHYNIVQNIGSVSGGGQVTGVQGAPKQ